MQELTGFRRDILYTLLGTEEPTGTKINELLEDRYNEHVYHGRLYDNLDTLIERGLVEKDEIDGRTNCYRITDKGEQAILDHRQWQSTFVNKSQQPITAD